MLCQAKYALIASFLLDTDLTDSVFAAAIGAVDGSVLAETIQHTNIVLLVIRGTTSESALPRARQIWARRIAEMGACCGKQGETKEEKARRGLFVKACKFLVAMPDGAATVNEDNVDVVRTEIERREALPPLVLTIQDLDGSNEEITATVARWDRIGASLSKGLDQYYRVTRVLFGGIELKELTLKVLSVSAVSTAVGSRGQTMAELTDAVIDRGHKRWRATDGHLTSAQFKENIVMDPNDAAQIMHVVFSELGIKALPEFLAGYFEFIRWVWFLATFASKAFTIRFSSAESSAPSDSAPSTNWSICCVDRSPWSYASSPWNASWAVRFDIRPFFLLRTAVGVAQMVEGTTYRSTHRSFVSGVAVWALERYRLQSEMLSGEAAFTRLESGEFKASWPPALRQSLLSRALDAMMWPSPAFFLIAVLIIRVRHI